VPWPVAASLAALVFLAVSTAGGLVSAAGIPVRRRATTGASPGATPGEVETSAR